MEIILHRINSIARLQQVPAQYGCEIDIRTDGSKLILHHDALKEGDSFLDYLDEYKHGTLVLNIKESGIEDLVLSEVRKRNIESYFLLDVEFPYLYAAAKKGERAIAVRYSESEPMVNSLLFENRVDWMWIDTNTMLPLNEGDRVAVTAFKSCLVCPSRWSRPQDIVAYRQRLSNIGISLDAVMTEEKYVGDWS